MDQDRVSWRTIALATARHSERVGSFALHFEIQNTLANENYRVIFVPDLLNTS